MMTIVITIWQVMMLMMTGHFSPKLVSKILRAVVQQKPVMKSMKACFPHSLSQNLRYTGLGSNGKYELKSAGAAQH